MLASSCVFLLFINNKEKFKESKIITSMSELSFGIYLIHPVFLDVIKENTVIVKQLSYVFIPVYTIIIFFASYISSFIIKKIPLLNRILK